MGKRLQSGRGAFVSGTAGEAGGEIPAGKPAARVRAKPKPRRAPKAGGSARSPWPKEKEAIFFRELGIVCNVAAALRAAGLLRRSRDVYERRKKDAAFRLQWEDALSESRALMALELHERARFGDDRPEPADEIERKLRAVPTALAMQLLKLYEGRAAKAITAAQPVRRRDPERRRALRRELMEQLSEMNRRMGGEG